MQGGGERLEIAHLSDCKHDKKILSMFHENAIRDYYKKCSKLALSNSASVRDLKR
ncbi:hypothetical protein GCM10008943_07030 [Paenochrobactrum glaciei]|uniref:Uncharacterized protein n=1 Tax=Paenochrobactrum glaciei TaxID=486407 RepID=A0ABP3QQ49_9HYPH